MSAYNYSEGRILGSSHEVKESINREGYESLQSDITRTIYVNREPVAVEVAAHQSERYGYNYIEDQNELSRFEGEISLGGTRIA